MTEYIGIPISEGITLGSVFFMANTEASPVASHIDDIEKEIHKLNSSLDAAAGELNELYEKALESEGESVADIFMIHCMMLQDDDFRTRMVELIVKERCSAQVAVLQAAQEFSQDLAESGSNYIADRGVDISDVAQRVLRHLNGNQSVKQPSPDKKIILVANEITPSMTFLFDRSQLLGLVCSRGSSTNHTSILARSLGIPAVITPGITYTEDDIQGKLCIVNGSTGAVCFDPDIDKVQNAEKEIFFFKKRQKDLRRLIHLPAITKSGTKVLLYANAGSLKDVDEALALGAEGIGLFRSEFLYMGRNTLPSEDELADVYTKAVKKLDGKPLVIRTLDIGADKQTDCIPLEHEENPALGIRGLRLCFERQDLFDVQLKAILRAAKAGPVSIMFPMVCSVSEIRRAKASVLAASADLEKQDVPHSNRVDIGIMIETPAAAIISDLLAKEVSFFSIGTNDLIQFTLAVDRQNQAATAYCDTHHESILRLIEMVIRNAHAAGVTCSICGELGADLSLTERLVQSGIDKLSLVPNRLLPIKQKIRELE
ncbi:MAG: phosphoenolpyruvate--protein phosphotransferase [Treponema sp.]|nr:phosphoenolpyruvate--protein phosphotransferase [Treponema sp.]